MLGKERGEFKNSLVYGLTPGAVARPLLGPLEKVTSIATPALAALKLLTLIYVIS